VARVAELVRVLTDRTAAPPRLWLVTTGAVALTDAEPVAPGTAGLSGLVRVLAFEHPELRASAVDLAAFTAGADLRTELLADRTDDQVAWRAGTRYAAALARAEVDASAGQPVVRDGAYVITGGLGELGQRLAGWLAERGASRIVLCGRTARPITAVTGNAEVHVVLGDIAEPGVALRAVEVATGGGLPLRGAVHAAMVLRDRAVATLGAADLAQVWRPKVEGALRLHEATKGHDLDWWLAFSSAAGVFGSPGQGSYATANAWLDAFTAWRRARGLPGSTINWGPWGTDRDNPVLEPLGFQEGFDALESVLASGRAATTVSRLDAAAVGALFPELTRRPFLAEFAVAAPGPEDGWTAPDPADPGARRQIIDRLRWRVAGLMGFEPDQVDVDAGLTGLGLDSLMAMRARNCVEFDFGATLPVPLLLKGASIADLADHLLGAAPSASPGPRDATERWVASLWREVLGERELTVHADFHALGGDADQLVATITEQLGTAPDRERLFARPTLAAMADELRTAYEGDADAGPVTTLRGISGGDRPPLFLFHPAGGPISVYRELVARLGADQPCIGFERLDEYGSIPERAARYVELLKELQPAGPYRLAGWSFGGYLAYEVASQLTGAGDRVDLVTLVDSILPLESAGSPEQLVLERYQRFAEHMRQSYQVDFRLPVEELTLLGEDEQINRVMALVEEQVPAIGRAILRHQYTSYVDARLAERYRPQPYAGPVLLLRAQDHHTLTTALDSRYRRTDEALGWDALCTDLSVLRVPGDHISMIDPPNVDVLAARLGAALGALDPAPDPALDTAPDPALDPTPPSRLAGAA
jgi:phthiocerol/phenolphthiocerol synthesis type-I polyketide synthase D